MNSLPSDAHIPTTPVTPIAPRSESPSVRRSSRRSVAPGKFWKNPEGTERRRLGLQDGSSPRVVVKMKKKKRSSTARKKGDKKKKNNNNNNKRKPESLKSSNLSSKPPPDTSVFDGPKSDSNSTHIDNGSSSSLQEGGSRDATSMGGSSRRTTMTEGVSRDEPAKVRVKEGDTSRQEIASPAKKKKKNMTWKKEEVDEDEDEPIISMNVDTIAPVPISEFIPRISGIPGSEVRTPPASIRKLHHHEVIDDGTDSDAETVPDTVAYATPPLASLRPLDSQGPAPPAPRKAPSSISRLTKKKKNINNKKNINIKKNPGIAGVDNLHAKDTQVELRAPEESSQSAGSISPAAVYVARSRDLKFHTIREVREDSEVSEVSERPKVAWALSLNTQVLTGELHIPGRARTGAHTASNGDEYYFVHSGIVSFTQNTLTVEMGEGDHFCVPHMTKFTLENNLRQTAKLVCFTSCTEQ